MACDVCPTVCHLNKSHHSSVMVQEGSTVFQLDQTQSRSSPGMLRNFHFLTTFFCWHGLCDWPSGVVGDLVDLVVALLHHGTKVSKFLPKSAPSGHRYKCVCPVLNTNEIQIFIPRDKHHKVSSWVKSLLNTHKPLL